MTYNSGPMMNTNVSGPVILTSEQAIVEIGESDPTQTPTPSPAPAQKGDDSSAAFQSERPESGSTDIVAVAEGAFEASAAPPLPPAIEAPGKSVADVVMPTHAAAAPSIVRRRSLRRTTKSITTKPAKSGLGAQAGLTFLAAALAQAEAVLSNDVLRRLHALTGNKRRAAMAILDHVR